jgi:hypothetical protein
MLRIQDLSNEEVIKRLLAIDKAELAEYLLAQQFFFSKDNMINRCDDNWPELRVWIEVRPRKLYMELLQRCTDLQFVRGSLLQHFEQLEIEQDEAMEQIAIKLLSPEELKLHRGKTSSGLSARCRRFIYQEMYLPRDSLLIGCWKQPLRGATRSFCGSAKG